MAGRKVRTWGRDMPRVVQAAGAVPVTLGLADLYEALGRGTVDCIPFSVDLMINYNPDFFADFIEEQKGAGRGDAAMKTIEIWREVVGG